MNTAPLDAMSRHPRRLVETDGAMLSYREAGSGEPMVLLHGISSSSASWLPFFEAMRGYRLIAWDAPGYGRSSPLPARHPRAADYAQRLVRFLDALGLGRIVLVGHSLGALMAGALAASKPGRVEALVLVSPASGYGAATEETRRNMVEGRLGLLHRLGPQGLAEQRWSHLLSPDASAEAAEWVRSGMRELDPAGYAQAVHMLAGGRLTEDARAYPGPVLVLAAAADTVTPAEGCRTVAAAFSCAEFGMLSGSGHASHIEAPRALAGEIAAFLRKAKASS